MKKNRFLLLIILLLCIGVNKVKAETYKCYYRDPANLSSASLEDNSYKFVSCNDLKDLDPGYLFLELEWNSSYSNFRFVDRSSNKSTNSVCVVDTDGTTILRHYTISSKGSGKSLTKDDFADGCPKYIYRFYTPTKRMDDSTLTNYIVDNFNKSKNSYYYEQGFEKSLSATDLWAGANDSTWDGAPESQTDSKCIDMNDPDKSDPALLFSMADTKGGPSAAPHPMWCGAVKQEDTPDTKDDPDGKYVKCRYYQDLQYDQTEKANYEVKDLDTHLLLKFLKEDGSFNYGYQYVNYKEVEANFSLSKNEEGNYECPKVVYECSGGIKKSPCSGETIIQYSLITSLGKGDITEIDNCTSFGVLGEYISGAYVLIRYLIPTLIVALSTIDFVGVVFSGEQEKMEKAKYKFMMRLIIGVVTLLVPFLLELILKLAGVIGGGESLADIACGFFG